MRTSIDRRAALQSLATLAVGGTCLAGRAQTTPALDSLQIVVPTPPGSQPDLIARWIAEPMARRTRLPVTVLNRPGAAGAIAADAVLAAPPERGALLLGGLDHVAYSHLNSNRRALDPLVDFVPVGSVNRDSWVLCTGADHAARSPAALAAWSRTQGMLNYASNGEGSTAHLLTARLCTALGIEAQHVPYKDPWMPDLIAGRIDFVVAPTLAVVGPLKGGRLRALASLTDERLAFLEGVPSIRELGWPGQVFHGGLFLFAPAPLKAHAARINGWLLDALAQPEVVQRYREAGIEPTPLELEPAQAALRQRLQTIDAMRLAVFGRTR